MTAPVWIDTDMGADDLFAILLVLAHRPVAGLSLSFGCTLLPQVVRNAAGASEVLGWQFPIVAGAARPILGPVETAERILGRRGYLTRGATLPTMDADYPPALPALARHLQTGGDLLALGPLTNLATLALARPDLDWPQVVWMGGSTGRGNHTPAAEYNALADPEALAILLERGVRIRMIDLEICRKVQIGEAEVARVAARSPLLGDLLGGYLDIALSRGRESMALYDPVAAAALTHPEQFDLVPVELDVDVTRTDARARTRAETGSAITNAEIATGVAADAVRELCVSALEERI